MEASSQLPKKCVLAKLGDAIVENDRPLCILEVGAYGGLQTLRKIYIFTEPREASMEINLWLRTMVASHHILVKIGKRSYAEPSYDIMLKLKTTWVYTKTSSALSICIYKC